MELMRELGRKGKGGGVKRGKKMERLPVRCGWSCAHPCACGRQMRRARASRDGGHA